MIRKLAIFILIAIAVGLSAACSRTGPAPVEYKGSDPKDDRLKPDPRMGARPVIKSAAKFATAGPTINRHRVRAGETLYAIARHRDVAMGALIEQNNLRPPYRLRPGQLLRLPKPRHHQVRQGETVYAIARRYGVGLRALVLSNRIPPPYLIKVGQRLSLPDRVDVAEAAPVATPQRTVKPTRKTATDLPKPPYRALNRNKTWRKKPPRNSAALPARAGRRFAWPTRGPVISRFGVKPGGRYNDGINIKVKTGSRVRAAENGIVAYAGNELRGFGNLLLIRHAGGWITAYAHNSKLLVRPGDRVRRGQTIARAGSSGRVRSPQLHFEIRKGRRAVDPLRYLAGGAVASIYENGSLRPNARRFGWPGPG